MNDDKMLVLEEELRVRYEMLVEGWATPSSILLDVLNAVAAVNRAAAPSEGESE